MAGFNVGAWDYGKWGAAGFGKVDIAAARDQYGASDYSLWQLTDRARREGVEVGPLAEGLMGARPNAPVDYGAHGYWGMGMRDIEHIMGQGGDVGQVEAAKRWAIDNNVQIGGDVNNWIRDEKQRVFMDQMTRDTEEANRLRDEKQRQWMQNQAATQQAHRDFMAAEQIKANERMARTRSSEPQGVGNNAAFRGSRLTSTTPGSGRGTQRFSRVTQPLFMNPLGGVASTQSKSNVNL